LFSTLQLLTYPESHVDEIYDESFLAAWKNSPSQIFL
jgi:hypothetical protein